MKERIIDYIINGRLYGVKPVTKEEYMKNCRDRTGEGEGDEEKIHKKLGENTNETTEGTPRTYCRDCVHYQGIRRIAGWGECARRQKTVLGDHFSCPFFEHFIDRAYNSLDESPNSDKPNETPTNETPEEEAKINLGENIDETKLVLGDTPFLDKYIPIEWLEHYAESYEKNANQLQVLISRPEDPFRPLLANQYRQVLTAWRISGAASYPLWKSSVQNTDTPAQP